MYRLAINLCFTLIILCLGSGFVGCQTGTGSNGLYGSTRVQPPPTNWTASNSYYNPKTTAQAPAGLINPTGKAPTGTGIYQQTNPSPPVGAAANPGYTTSGASYTASTNYLSTSVDETLDQSRLPVTDATAVRAPVQTILPPTVATMASQNPYNRNPASPNPTYSAQGAQYAAVPNPTGGPTPYAGHPTLNQPATAQNTNVVLAESTARVDTNSPNYRIGWRNDSTGSQITR